MKAKVMETIEKLGFNIVRTGHAYGLDYESAIIHAEREDLRINAVLEINKWAERTFRVRIVSGLREANDAYFHFEKGKAPHLEFREHTPELLELARRFGAVAGCKI